MNQTRKKLARVQRLRNLEHSKLNLLAVELSELQTQIIEQTRRLSTLQSQLDNLSAPSGRHAVAALYQTKVWCESLQSQVTVLKSEIDEAEAKRDQMMVNVVDQRATVRGWESLIERLQDTFASEAEKLGSMQADDRFLNNRTAR